MSRRKGFTLVELLVVIGIIALLISILLPSLNKARKQANTVKCLASLRQVGQAFQLYTNAFKGVLPCVENSFAGGDKWVDLLYPMIGGKSGETISSTWGSQTALNIATSIMNGPLNGCPEKLPEGTHFSDLMWYRGNYGYYPWPLENTGVPPTWAESNWINLGGKYFKLSQYKPATQRGMVADMVPNPGFTWPGMNSAPPPDQSNTNIAYYRHASRATATSNQASCNVLFADGHAATLPPVHAYRAFTAPNSY